MMRSLENVANYGNPEESLAIPANREKPRGMYYTDPWVMGAPSPTAQEPRFLHNPLLPTLGIWGARIIG